MSVLVSVLIWILVAGVVLYLVNQYVPMHPAFKTIFNVVVVIALIIWLLRLVPGVNLTR